MKKLWFVLPVLSLSLLACKPDVGFSTMDQVSYVEPENPQSKNGPQVKIVKGPSDQMIDEENEVVFEVTPGSSEIAQVVCSIDQIELPCDWMKGVLKIFPMPMGEHWFQVEVEDVEGLKAFARDPWKVYNRYSRIRENFVINQHQKKTDILFVIDNSSSMRDEQTKISQRFEHFVDKIQDLDWHIAITTTDPRDDEKGSDGQIDPFNNQYLFLKSSMDQKKAQELFAKHVKRTESGWDTEMGINATYRAIERTLNPRTESDKKQAQFFREESALAVVVVSDEDESGAGVKSQGRELIKLIQTKWGNQKRFQFSSIVAYTSACLNGGGGHTRGKKYEELTAQTQGILGDICAQNYSDLLRNLGQGVANLQKVVKLQCVPQDLDGDGKVDLQVLPKSGQKIPGYVIVNDQLEFDQPLKNGSYQLHYFCFDKK